MNNKYPNRIYPYGFRYRTHCLNEDFRSNVLYGPYDQDILYISFRESQRRLAGYFPVVVKIDIPNAPRITGGLKKPSSVVSGPNHRAPMQPIGGPLLKSRETGDKYS